MKKISLSILAVLMCWVVWSNRWIFSAHYEPDYFQDWYDHSQWVVPLSPRTMGDSELYQLSGYTLVQGDSPFHINPEVPPLVKYAYGLSILATGNPYYASLLFYFATLGAFAWLTYVLFPKSARSRFLAIVLFLANPLFSSQISQVALDLPQLCFLLFHIVFLWTALRLQKANQPTWKTFGAVVLSGIFLGMFAATKIGIFTPLILLADAVLLWRRKNLRWALCIGSAAVFAYMLSYAAYFLAGHSIIEWLKAQKWMIQFYRSSQVRQAPGVVFLALLCGRFWHWASGYTVIREWSISWVAGCIGYIYFAKKNIQRAHELWLHVFLMCTGLFFFIAIIPFWARYLILIVPFLLLFFVQLLEELRLSRFMNMFLFGVIFVQCIWYAFPQPTELIELSSSAWSTHSYEELYNFTDGASTGLSRAKFTVHFQKIRQALHDPKTEILIDGAPFIWPWQNEVKVPVIVRYTTEFGQLSVPSKLHLRRAKQRWQIVWRWDALLPKYTGQEEPQLTLELAKKGTLLTSDGETISTEGTRPFIQLEMHHVVNLEKILSMLTTLANTNAVEQRNRVRVTNRNWEKITIGFPQQFYNPAVLEELQKEDGVMIFLKTTRVYNPLLISDKNFPKVQNFEKAHPEIEGQNGATLTLKKSDGTELTIFQQEKVDGKDVVWEGLAREVGE